MIEIYCVAKVGLIFVSLVCSSLIFDVISYNCFYLFILVSPSPLNIFLNLELFRPV